MGGVARRRTLRSPRDVSSFLHRKLLTTSTLDAGLRSTIERRGLRINKEFLAVSDEAQKARQTGSCVVENSSERGRSLTRACTAAKQHVT